ncbi:MAG: HrcA family transcriptional regulator [Eubacteriales bacterium]|nr:HrcA family transcriptional regulator [Eubacteriales bacterium]
MSEWRNWGYELHERIDCELYPETLKENLNRYKKVLGKEFDLSALLKIKDIQAKHILAAAISDAPEYMGDQLGILMRESWFPDLESSLERIADAMENME